MLSPFYTPAQKVERFMRVQEAMDAEVSVGKTAFGLSSLDPTTAEMQLSRYLRQEFGPAYHFWIGFYNRAEGLLPGGRWIGEDYLTLGPHASDADQNGHGCSIIPFPKGACGYAARNQKTVIIPDTQHWTPDDAAAYHARGKTVEGIIHCSTKASSEIVVPVFSQGGKGKLIAVLDIDSSIDPAHATTFDATDQEHLEALLKRYFT